MSALNVMVKKFEAALFRNELASLLVHLLNLFLSYFPAAYSHSPSLSFSAREGTWYIPFHVIVGAVFLSITYVFLSSKQRTLHILSYYTMYEIHFHISLYQNVSSRKY